MRLFGSMLHYYYQHAACYSLPFITSNYTLSRNMMRIRFYYINKRLSKYRKEDIIANKNSHPFICNSGSQIDDLDQLADGQRIVLRLVSELGLQIGQLVLQHLDAHHDNVLGTQ